MTLYGMYIIKYISIHINQSSNKHTSDKPYCLEWQKYSVQNLVLLYGMSRTQKEQVSTIQLDHQTTILR